MKMTCIAALNSRHDLQLITDSQDVEEYRKQFPGYDSFFIKIGECEVIELWGYVGLVPYLSKLVTRLI